MANGSARPSVATLGAVKGDRVEVLVDVGGGVERFEIEATRAGRRVEVGNARGTIEVTEVTRSGTAVRTARFMAAKVVAVVEHPARDGEVPARPRAKAGGRRGNWSVARHTYDPGQYLHPRRGLPEVVGDLRRNRRARPTATAPPGGDRPTR
jgi:hypothetical protein